MSAGGVSENPIPDSPRQEGFENILFRAQEIGAVVVGDVRREALNLHLINVGLTAVLVGKTTETRFAQENKSILPFVAAIGTKPPNGLGFGYLIEGETEPHFIGHKTCLELLDLYRAMRLLEVASTLNDSSLHAGAKALGLNLGQKLPVAETAILDYVSSTDRLQIVGEFPEDLCGALVFCRDRQISVNMLQIFEELKSAGVALEPKLQRVIAEYLRENAAIHGLIPAYESLYQAVRRMELSQSEDSGATFAVNETLERSCEFPESDSTRADIYLTRARDFLSLVNKRVLEKLELIEALYKSTFDSEPHNFYAEGFSHQDLGAFNKISAAIYGLRLGYQCWATELVSNPDKASILRFAHAHEYLCLLIARSQEFSKNLHDYAQSRPYGTPAREILGLSRLEKAAKSLASGLNIEVLKRLGRFYRLGEYKSMALVGAHRLQLDAHEQEFD